MDFETENIIPDKDEEKLEEKTEKKSIEIKVQELSHQYTQIISVQELQQHSELYWGGNGVGDRWARKKFNYTVIYAKKTKTYSENEEDHMDNQILEDFWKKNANMKTGIIGIFVHSPRINVIKRPIRKDILDVIRCQPCVVCGSKTDIICDHKNDLYNEERVLHTESQTLEDFQPLCNHCNLQKRQIFKEETQQGRLYSAKQMARYRVFPFEFPWEKKAFDSTDFSCKTDTFWYDPVEFEQKIFWYSFYLFPIVQEMKRYFSNLNTNPK
jgi:hypothetical protein